MKNEKNREELIELRSEEARKVIDTMPSSLILWTVVIVVCIFIILLSVVFLVPSPLGEGETIFDQWIL